MSITPEIAQKIQSANIANIFKKVKAGKVLTASEQRQLQEATSEDPQLVPQKKICEIFNITRKTIAQWRREGKENVPPKNAGGEDLEAWRKFFASNPDAGFFDGKPRADRESLLCQKLEVEIEIARLKRSKLEGELISLADVNDAMTSISATLRTAISRQKADLPPVLEGLTAAQMASRIEEYGASMMAQIREMLETKRNEWQSKDD